MEAEFSPGVDQHIAYVPIRVLGHGAFGEAVLYRKVEDNELVVWKEVDLKRLGEKERRDAQNEIDILSMLNHTNIISYYNHFLDGDTLLIEMEYANGGSLYEKISVQKEPFKEEIILWYFYQLTSAMGHIHDHGILHRDVKTLNIFLTKAGLVKLGDFGISKVLDTKSQMVESYVGTPYYMSPELIKGEQYSQPSDIWAMGCVLYELLTLTRVFDATNPLRLAHEIVRGNFTDVDNRFSEAVRQIVKAMLNKDPRTRPKTDDILKHSIFTSISKDVEKKVWELNSSTRRAKMSVAADVTVPVVTSTTSEVYYWGGGKLTPQKLEVFTKGRSAVQVAAGHAHFAVVTVEKELYTWANVQGGGVMVGQLGQGDTAAYKAPRRVEELDGVPVKQVACGEDFTLCLTDEGAVYAFGSDYYGCLACANEQGDERLLPVQVDFFSSRPVTQLSCGDSHAVALTMDGDVFTWGCGEFGRLGLGTEEDHALPKQVELRGRHGVRAVHSGPDGTFLIKTNGRLLACGSNEHNKLGFNSAARGLRKHKQQVSYDIPCKYSFTTVKPLSKYNIWHVSSGTNHTAALDCYGHLFTFGNNRYGQLGCGDLKERNGVSQVAGVLTGKQVQVVSCGDAFTVAATAENEVFSWGLMSDGRLGSVSADKEKGGASQGYSLPRPIFGSLHMVSNLACHHWNTIIVAEKFLTQKTIKSTATGPRGGTVELTEEAQSVFDSSAGGASGGSTTDTQVSTSSNSEVPAWLKAELDEAEFIPAGGAGQQSPETEPAVPQTDMPANTAAQGQEDMPPWLKKELEQAEYIPMQGSEENRSLLPSLPSSGPPTQPSTTSQIQSSLSSQSCDQSNNSMSTSADTANNDATTQSQVKQLLNQISKLKAENKCLLANNSQLQELVQQQADTIQQQTATICHLEDKCREQLGVERDIWRLVSRWEQEWKGAIPLETASPMATDSGVMETVSGNDPNQLIIDRDADLTVLSADTTTVLAEADIRLHINKASHVDNNDDPVDSSSYAATDLTTANPAANKRVPSRQTKTECSSYTSTPTNLRVANMQTDSETNHIEGSSCATADLATTSTAPDKIVPKNRQTNLAESSSYAIANLPTANKRVPNGQSDDVHDTPRIGHISGARLSVTNSYDNLTDIDDLSTPTIGTAPEAKTTVMPRYASPPETITFRVKPHNISDYNPNIISHTRSHSDGSTSISRPTEHNFPPPPRFHTSKPSSKPTRKPSNKSSNKPSNNPPTKPPSSLTPADNNAPDPDTGNSSFTRLVKKQMKRGPGDKAPGLDPKSSSARTQLMSKSYTPGSFSKLMGMSSGEELV